MVKHESRHRGENDTAAAMAATDAATADGAAGAVAETPDAPRPHDRREVPRKRRVWLRVLVAVVVLLVLVAGALAGAFAWDRWYRYDDAADFQGRWYPAGSAAAIVIDGAEMSFDAETAYAYELDTQAKTVTYSLANLRGMGHYWFTDDRNTLVIEDGDDFTAAGTAFGDLGRMLASLNAAIDGRTPPLPEGDDVTVLSRTPDEAAVTAKAEAEAAAAAKAEAEAAAEAAAKAESGAETEVADDAGAEEVAAPDAESAAPDAETESVAGTDADAAAKPDAEPQDFANESMGIFE